jgi:hypothetical protein
MGRFVHHPTNVTSNLVIWGSEIKAAWQILFCFIYVSYKAYIKHGSKYNQKLLFQIFSVYSAVYTRQHISQYLMYVCYIQCNFQHYTYISNTHKII